MFKSTRCCFCISRASRPFYSHLPVQLAVDDVNVAAEKVAHVGVWGVGRPLRLTGIF
jgi:hypothetical protein